MNVNFLIDLLVHCAIIMIIVIITIIIKFFVAFNYFNLAVNHWIIIKITIINQNFIIVI